MNSSLLGYRKKRTAHISLWWPREVKIYNAVCFCGIWDMLNRSVASWNHVYCSSILFRLLHKKNIYLPAQASCIFGLQATSPQSPHSSVWGTVWMLWVCAVFFQPCGGCQQGQRGSSDGWEWADTGSEMHHVCKPQDHQLLHSSNRAEEGSEVHSQMASKACSNSMSITANIRSHVVSTRLSSSTFWAYGPSRYCLWTLLMQTRSLVYDRTDINQEKWEQLCFHVHTRGLWVELLYYWGFLSDLITPTQKHILQRQGSALFRECSCLKVSLLILT